jgi:hypothetical protein
MRRFSRISASYLAYILLLMAFVALGVFVASLAAGSRWAGATGIALIACLGGAVAGFRAGARELAQSRQPGDRGSAVSIFSAPLRQDQVDRYVESYRSSTSNLHRSGVLTVLPGGESTEDDGRSADGRRHADATGGARRLSA